MQRSPVGVRMGRETTDAVGTKLGERCRQIRPGGAGEVGQLEDRAHGAPDGAPEVGVSRGLANNDGLNAEGRRITNHGPDVLRVAQAINCGKQARAGQAQKFVHGRRPGHLRERELALENREPSEASQDVPAGDEQGDGFRTGRQQRFVIRHALGRHEH